jgi:hypothetical protein
MGLLYNVKKLTGNWSPGGTGITFNGYMKGTFLEVAYDVKQTTQHKGADGTLSVVLNPDFTATAKLTIVQGSSTNDDLAAQVPNALINSLPTGDFQFTDLNGNTAVHSQNAYLDGFAKIVFGEDVEGREWTFILPSATIVPGGAETF